MNQRKKETGITLVALVITIILMLILAGIAISALTGGDGLIGKAQNAAELYQNAAKNEAEAINQLLEQVPSADTSKQIKKVNLEVIVNSSNEIAMNTTVEREEGYEGELIYEYFIQDKSIGESTEISKTVSDLTPNTTYKIYVMVRDQDGGIKFSNIVKVKTKERIYLYKEGDECIDITGGWEGVKITDIISMDGTVAYVGQLPSITKNADHIYSKLTHSSAMAAGALSTANMIDLSKYSTLRMDLSGYFSPNLGYNVLHIGITPVKTSRQRSFVIKNIYNVVTPLPRKIVEVDISNINESAYIQIVKIKNTAATAASGYYIQTNLYNAWLE